jgi:hypothetical protein
LKAGVVPNSVADSSAVAPYRELSSGFFASMGSNSAFARIMGAGDFSRTPLRTLVSILSTAPVGYSVSALAPKPISSLDFTSAQLEVERVSAIIVITDALARSLSPAATAKLGDELRRACGVALDAKFLALMNATPGHSTAATTGVTASAILSDLTARINALTIGADSSLWAIVGPKLYKTLQLVEGNGGLIVQNGAIGPIKLAVSDAASTVLTLIDAKQVAAELDQIQIDSTREASLELDTDPATDGSSGAVSLWANNSTGLRCEVSFGAIATRSTAITTITGYAA